MYFGEFLLKQKVITEEQLLEALIFQVENLPSFLRVLRDEKIFSPNEIVQLIQLQLESDDDLISVLREKKKIDQKAIQRLFSKQVAGRKMLGSVLVELKFAGQAVIEKMLHEFLHDKDNLQKIKKENEISTTEIIKEIGEGKEIQTSPSEEKSANIFVDEFINTYNEKMNNKLIKLIKILYHSTLDESDISNYYNSLYRELFVLKGSALLAELNFSAKLLDECAALIESKLTVTNNDQLKTWSVAAIPVFEESLTFLWELRGVISQAKSEENALKTNTYHDKYIKFISEISALSQ